MADTRAAFYLTFRKHPFNSNYTVACGLHEIIDYLSQWQFNVKQLDYLAQQKTRGGENLFSADFLNYLSELRFTGDLHAVTEGNLIFPQAPVLTIEAPIIEAQLLETALINMINFPTLVATKAARCRIAAGEQNEIIDFGLRRAHTAYAGLIAARAAFIGGCAGTSNVQAGYEYKIPLRGTQAHSWIMAFENELTAFEKFTQALPSHAILLVDTYNTLDGIKNAIKIARQLAEINQPLWSIRIDSGDLLELSRQARKLLNEAGLFDTKILASGDLDEYRIEALKKQNAPIDIWGVGTRLVTSYDQPSLNIVYKLSAIQDQNKAWQYRMKLSAQPDKMTLPGMLSVERKLAADGSMQADTICLQDEMTANKNSLLQPIFKSGKLIYQKPELLAVQENCQKAVKSYLKNWQDKNYPVAISEALHQLQTQTIHQITC